MAIGYNLCPTVMLLKMVAYQFTPPSIHYFKKMKIGTAKKIIVSKNVDSGSKCLFNIYLCYLKLRFVLIVEAQMNAFFVCSFKGHGHSLVPSAEAESSFLKVVFHQLFLNGALCSRAFQFKCFSKDYYQAAFSLLDSA